MVDKAFETKLISYKSMKIEDTETVLRLRNSDHVRENFIYQKIITKEQHIEYYNNQILTGRIIQYVMTEKQTGNAIGCTLLKDIDYETKQAEFGIFIGETDALGKGYGTDALCQMKRIAFEELKLKKLILRVLGHNEIAYNLYSKMGFNEESRYDEDSAMSGKSRTIINMALYNREV